MRRLPRGDDGNAAVEFVYLSVMLMVPLVYVMLSVFALQRASFGATEAARQAGRTFVTSGCDADRAERAARMALADQGYDGGMVLTGLRCPEPGQGTVVRVEQFVQLPGLGALLPARRGGFQVSATFVAVRDRFAP